MDRQVYNILEKYYRNKCSPEEVRILMSHFNTESEQELLDYIMKGFELEKKEFNYGEADKETLDAVYAKLEEQIRGAGVSPKQRRLWPRITIAAAVAAIVVSAGIYFYNNSERGVLKQVQDDVVYKQDIAPGKNTAILTVNGKQTQLSDNKTGVVINANNITYNDGSTISEATAETLTLTTPRGGTYYAVLSDGTKIWLNADSKLELLPNFWNKAQRLVKLTGEAYFEVAKNKRRPFIVQSAGQSVTVLGTHFNISAYQGEGIRTTLLEGSVRVVKSPPYQGGVPAGGGGKTGKTTPASPPLLTKEGISMVLKPGDQAYVTGNSGIKITQVNAADAIDWKNGEFVFKNEPITDILRRVSRWYNVSINYQVKYNTVPTFTGTVSRFDNVSSVLRMLEKTGDSCFEINGKTIIVKLK